MSNSPQNQVFVEVTSGIAEVTVTAGEVDVIFIDWDSYRDGYAMLEDMEDTLVELNRIVPGKIRDRATRSLEKHIEDYKSEESERLEWEEKQRQNRIEEARRVLQEAGEL